MQVNGRAETPGRLNPTWVEWLMGCPLGWTDCELSETASSLKISRWLGEQILEREGVICRVTDPTQASSAAQGQRDPYEGAPLILYRCPNCDRVFDSPSVCVEDGSQAVAYVRPIKLALVKKLPPGQPMGEGILGIPGIWADAYIAVDFEKGEAEVFPVEIGFSGTAGPSHTEGLDLRVKVERKS